MVDTSILRRWAPFSDLSERACATIAGEARLVEYSKDHRIYSALRPTSLLYLVDTGLCKLVGIHESGGERIIFAFRPGDLIGSHVFLERSREKLYDVVVLAPGRFIQIRKETLQAANERDPLVMTEVVKLLAHRLERLHGRIMAAMSDEVGVRLARLLLDFAAEDVADGEPAPLAYPLTHRTMAEMVGASRPHVSTLLKEFERKNVVARVDRRLRVRRDRLETILSEAGVRPLRNVLGATVD